jgi:hypothetical protein
MSIVLAFLVLFILSVSLMAVMSETRPILYATAILMLCNDAIFINIGDAGNAALLAVAKSWREIFIVSSFVSFGLWLGRGRPGVGLSRWAALTLAALIVLAVAGVAVGLSRSSLGSVLTVGRAYILPFLLPLSLYVSGAFTRDRTRGLFWILMGIITAMTAYSAYASMTFNGDAASIWYYDFIADRKLEVGTGKRFIAYQIIRDGHLRASGFLISAVDYSQLCGVLAVFAITCSLLLPRVGQRLLCAVAGACCIASIEMSQTRAGYVSIGISAVVAVLYRGLRIRWAHFYTLLIAVGISTSLAVVQFAPNLFDASIGGRPAQLFAAMESFRPIGWGFGDLTNNGPTYKDSLYLSALGTFGLGLALFMGIFVALHGRLFRSLRLPNIAQGPNALLFASALTLTSMWFIFGFHYAIGGSAEYVLLLLCFASLAAVEMPNVEDNLPEYETVR